MDDMRGCTDDDHAFGCPCGVGGDPIVARCFVCERRERTGRCVEVQGEVRLCCDDCWSRDEPRLPVSYEVA